MLYSNRYFPAPKRARIGKAQGLGPYSDLPDSARVAAKLGLRVDDADLHGAARRLPEGLHRAFFQSWLPLFARQRDEPVRGVLGVHVGHARFPSSREACACAGSSRALPWLRRWVIVAPPGHG